MERQVNKQSVIETLDDDDDDDDDKETKRARLDDSQTRSDAPNAVNNSTDYTGATAKDLKRPAFFKKDTVKEEGTIKKEGTVGKEGITEEDIKQKDMKQEGIKQEKTIKKQGIKQERTIKKEGIVKQEEIGKSGKGSEQVLTEPTLAVRGNTAAAASDVDRTSPRRSRRRRLSDATIDSTPSPEPMPAMPAGHRSRPGPQTASAPRRRRDTRKAKQVAWVMDDYDVVMAYFRDDDDWDGKTIRDMARAISVRLDEADRERSWSSVEHKLYKCGELSDDFRTTTRWQISSKRSRKRRVPAATDGVGQYDYGTIMVRLWKAFEMHTRYRRDSQGIFQSTNRHQTDPEGLA